MKLFLDRGRSGGKTTLLIKFVKEKNGILLCANQNIADSIISFFKLRKDQVMTWHTAMHGHGLKGLRIEKRPLYIDDCDRFIANIFEWPIAGATFSEATLGKLPKLNKKSTQK